jgi:hypothetical protein
MTARDQRTGQHHTSMPSTPGCPICHAWCASPAEHAFTTGGMIDAVEGHRLLVLGYYVALHMKGTGLALCAVHRSTIERLDKEQEILRSIANARPSS